MTLRVLAIPAFAILAFSTAAFAQTPTVTAVVNAADYMATLCPGVVAIVYGTNFGTNAANVSVTVGGKPAYVYASQVTAGQLAVEIPFELMAGPTTLTVTVGSAASNALNITLSTYAPAIPTQNGAGTGLGNVYDATTKNTVVTLTSPANAGDTLTLYCYGLGPTNPPTATGVGTTPNKTATATTVTVGGVNAVVTFAGVLPADPGFYQVNFVLPKGLQGTLPLVVSINGVSSQASVTVALTGLSSIVNSGSFAAPGTASPGSIVTAFANSLGTTTNVESALFPATSSEGIQVTFNGTAAPLLNVIASNAQQQVDLIVPSNLPTSGTVNVQLTTSTALYPNYTLNMVPANPGFFAFTDPKMTTRRNVVAQFNNTEWLALPASTTTNLGFPACTSTTTALTPCGQPATIGDYLVLYLTGLGLATPNGDPNGTPLPTGSVPPANGVPLYETPTKPVVKIGGIQANVLFSGLVPGVAGEYQIDIQVPSGVTNGDDIPVNVTILGASDSSTTISIQPGSITPPTS